VFGKYMNLLTNLIKFILGTAAGYSVTQLAWVLWQLAKADPRFTTLVPQNKAPQGITSAQGKTEANYIVHHAIEDGIERISYFPKERRFEIPILMQHGMWHGAWCWQPWQELFAEWGWESHAISLPGHGQSPEQRLVRLCTLDYYLDFLRNEAKKLDRKPVLMGHSMGGALTQWYLKYIGDDLPAAVLAASWVARSVRQDGGLTIVKQDPALVPLTMLSWDASAWVRTPNRTAEKLLGPKATVSPQQLHARLGPESLLIAFQHNPPFWQPPDSVKTPNFWLAGELDAVVSLPGLKASAAHYGGDFAIVPEAGHNLMMEHNARQTAKTIHDWLVAKGIT
jgi:pimeloyl-ACP methyl ester carboxylesterase